MGLSNCDWCNKLLDGICKGVDTGYNSVKKYFLWDNWNSVVMYLELVADYLVTEVTLGRKDGPFIWPTFSNSVVSPRDVVVK